jgi:Uma2 family endonuclease
MAVQSAAVVSVEEYLSSPYEPDCNREIEQVPTKPPLVCIEILSPEDRWARFEKRLQDFLTMGVECVWVFDPQERQVFECTKSGRWQVLDDLLEAPPVSIRISELMAELD